MKTAKVIFFMILLSTVAEISASSLYVDPEGNVGVGTDLPETKLHVLDGNLKVAQTEPGTEARIEFSTDGGLWYINQNANTGRLVFVAPDFPGAPFKFQPGAVDNLFRVGVMALDTVDINGFLVVNGVEIADYVFNPDYDLMTIEEQADFMFKNKHLPSVQKGDENLRANVDVMGNQMAMLEELEKAHIYITQLNASIKEMKAELDELKAK